MCTALYNVRTARKYRPPNSTLKITTYLVDTPATLPPALIGHLSTRNCLRMNPSMPHIAPEDIALHILRTLALTTRVLLPTSPMAALFPKRNHVWHTFHSFPPHLHPTLQGALPMMALHLLPFACPFHAQTMLDAFLRFYFWMFV